MEADGGGNGQGRTVRVEEGKELGRGEPTDNETLFFCFNLPTSNVRCRPPSNAAFFFCSVLRPHLHLRAPVHRWTSGTPNYRGSAGACRCTCTSRRRPTSIPVFISLRTTSGDMRKWVLCGLGIKKPNRNYEQKTIMNEGTFKYVIEAKTQEIRLKEEIVEEFTSGRMSRDKLKALEEAEKFNTAAQGLSESCPEWKPHKEIHEEYHEELKELEKKMEEVNAGENKQPHTTDKEPQYMGREKAAPLDEKILPYSKKALEVVVVQTGDGGIKIGMPMSKDLMEAKFPKSAMGARSVWRGSEEVVVESWNVQMGMCLMDEYSSEKTSRDCLKLLEVEKEFQPGGHRLHGEQTEWKPDREFPEEITSASKEEKSLPDKVLQDS